MQDFYITQTFPSPTIQEQWPTQQFWSLAACPSAVLQQACHAALFKTDGPQKS